MVKAVNLGKLARQLRREMLANPKKAAALGLVVLVAMYFWAPLIAGWCQGEKDNKTAVVLPTAAGAASPAAMSARAEPQGTATGLSAAPRPKEPQSRMNPWDKIVEWMDKSPWTKSAGPLKVERDPFLPAKTEVAEEKKAPPKPVEPDVTPQSLGVALSGTIIGAGRRTAWINGKTYVPGATVELTTKDGKHFAFTLDAVEARRIVLQRQGKQFEVKLSPAPSSGQIELFGNMH
jgi:hypothetical protein